MDALIRRATDGDLARITEIYNQAIAAGTCTGDLRPFRTEERRAWLKEHTNKRTPAYVYEENGDVSGYIYLSAYRPGREALSGTAEISYYVDFICHGRGIGSALLSYMLKEAKEVGYETLLAVVLECNVGSMALLEKHGFSQWGVLPGVAKMNGKTYAHFYYGRSV
ncbi:N-acetyltransferase family protein [Christensenellaceae bacterium OttesenSCG-928-M15]|nr:N-acetyltransferase family protein [Christensenellaceae bacterium OttesenSCG-928-M15]